MVSWCTNDIPIKNWPPWPPNQSGQLKNWSPKDIWPYLINAWLVANIILCELCQSGWQIKPYAYLECVVKIKLSENDDLIFSCGVLRLSFPFLCLNLFFSL